MKLLFTLIGLLTTLLSFTQSTKPTKEQQKLINEIFTPEYIIQASVTISNYKKLDSVLRERNSQILELNSELIRLKSLYRTSLRSIKTDVGIINDVSSYNIPESITITRKNTLSLTKNVSEDVYTLSYIKQVINSVGVIGSISNDNLKLNYSLGLSVSF